MTDWHLVLDGATLAALGVAAFGVIYTRRQARAATTSDAREEAMDLAETRGAMIQELNDRLSRVEDEMKHEQEVCAERIKGLEDVLVEVQRDATEAQRMLLVGVRGAMMQVLDHLEADPAEVTQAIKFLRDSLHEPPPPRRLGKKVA